MGGIKRIAITFVVFASVMAQDIGHASLLNLGPEQIVQSGGADIGVPGYSVPSYVDWNNDGLQDLIVGEGSGSYPAKVRVYLNVGTASSPQFPGYTYAQSSGGDLTCTGSGCLGCFPRVVQWDADGNKDLLVGQSNGTVKVFLNTNTDDAPIFDDGSLLQLPTGNIDVGYRATSTVVDWDNDGKKDLVVGALDGEMHLFINEGTDTSPDFVVETLIQEDGSALLVPSARSSPMILDLNGDGTKDILTGNTDGELLFYPNVGTDAEPLFSGSYLIESGGMPVDLFGSPRSRPFVCDWTGDGYLDILVGAGDGKIHLYQGVPEPATALLLGLGCLLVLRKKRL
ncbi:MAG: FG-GAP repeat domain-containing protein [Planctomycetota bacterium]|jgi:hypothetical protein